jgi:hypothetical protein
MKYFYASDLKKNWLFQKCLYKLTKKLNKVFKFSFEKVIICLCNDIFFPLFPVTLYNSS